MEFENVKLGMTGTCTGRKGSKNAGKKVNFTVVGGDVGQGSYIEVQVDGETSIDSIYVGGPRILSHEGDYKNFKFNK